MLAIRMRFLAGRFHATPWGHHVNEGVVEYPPSLWRLLRSLVATFYRAFPAPAHENGGDNEAVAQLKSILAKLSTPPEYHLPNAAIAHTRHYDQANDGVKFFDTFISVNPTDELLWLWRDAVLNEKEREALAKLLAALGTFGRAEAWCEAELLSEEEARSLTATPSDATRLNSQPFTANDSLAGLETMRLLLPDAQANADQLFEMLKIETATMRQQKHLEPEGSCWVTYTRPQNILQPRRSKPINAKRERRYTVARFALSSSVLPLVTDAMPFAETARFALSRCRAGNSYSPALTGKGGDGVPLAGHEHAHFFVTDEDEDGRLDHLTVYAPCGFNRDDVGALGQLPPIKRYKNLPKVRTVLLGLGEKGDFKDALIFRSAKRWRSMTPFSLPRFANRGGGKPPRPRDLPEAQLTRELRNRGLPEPVKIIRVDSYRTDKRPPFRWLEFHTRRLRKETEGHGLAGFEIEFLEPVAGPIALGFGCHFGLGLFAPVKDEWKEL
ncbi:MAG TPA: type I-U CRISPR-associated protein Csb2 [Pyrinomonadaceae bacterium]|jgi:CRISPR-associated protein Csb2